MGIRFNGGENGGKGNDGSSEDVKRKKSRREGLFWKGEVVHEVVFRQ